MKNSLKTGLGIFIGLLAFSVFGHGVEYQIIQGGVGIEIKYDDGSAFSYSEVKIYPPGDDTEYQSGLTDAQGRFVFYPDRAGKWKIIANDGLGHGVVAEVKITSNLLPQTLGKRDAFNRWEKIVLGLGIIFGLTGIWFWLSARKYLKQIEENAHS